MRSFAVTFEPHPERVLFPEGKLTSLSTAEERRQLLCDSGIDDVWVCPFTPELARLEPEEFMRLVTERQPIAELWVGADFALGRGRAGTLGVLADIGAHLGWALHMVPPYTLEGQVVSSTAIRTLLAAGAVRGVADLLGRNYSVSGTPFGTAGYAVLQETSLFQGLDLERTLHPDFSLMTGAGLGPRQRDRGA